MKANCLMIQCPQCPFHMLLCISCELVDGSRSVVRFRHGLCGKGILYVVLPSLVRIPAETSRSMPLVLVVSCGWSHFGAVQTDTHPYLFLLVPGAPCSEITLAAMESWLWGGIVASGTLLGHHGEGSRETDDGAQSTWCPLGRQKWEN